LYYNVPLPFEKLTPPPLLSAETKKTTRSEIKVVNSSEKRASLENLFIGGSGVAACVK